RLGGEPTNARLLFAIDFDMYKMRAILVSSAEIYRGCAVVVTDKNVEGMTLIIPQAADELLSIEGISASIVAVKQQNKVRISSRSLGAYNVQLIMESLGGGGHQTMAGVQLENLELDNVRAKIHGAIDKYLDDNAINGGS
ncbi:MAG: DHHA1 domain-containing protein, partial [Oscillospiraceae bacterium]